MKRKFHGKENATGWVFVTPYLLYATILFAVPLIWAFWLAGTDWNLMALSWNWIGLDNLKTAFTDVNVHKVFFNGLKYLVAIVPLVCIFSIGIAAVLHNLPARFKGIFFSHFLCTVSYFRGRNLCIRPLFLQLQLSIQHISS